MEHFEFILQESFVHLIISKKGEGMRITDFFCTNGRKTNQEYSPFAFCQNNNPSPIFIEKGLLQTHSINPNKILRCAQILTSACGVLLFLLSDEHVHALIQNVTRFHQGSLVARHSPRKSMQQCQHHAYSL